MSTTLEQQFAEDTNQAIEVCQREHNYNPTGIKGMIQRRQADGGSVVDAAVDLIHGGNVQSGFKRIWEISKKPGCEDAYKLTLEWMVTKPEYQTLFPDETVVLAKQRIKDYFGIG